MPEPEISLVLPATLRLVQHAPAGMVRRGAGSSDADVSGKALTDILVRQGLRQIADYRVARNPSPDPSLPSPPDTPAVINVSLEPSEGAVVLREDEGVLSWHFPSVEEAPRRPTRRSSAPAGGQRRAVFTLQPPTLPSPAPDPSVRRGQRRGLLTGAFRAIVLKFTATAVVDAASAALDDGVEPGFVLMDGDDPNAWQRVSQLPPLHREGRPARILLLLHGTFSSTLGSFGALTLYPWGRELLAHLRATHDIVAGYDHRTLQEDPHDNARSLIDDLSRSPWVAPPVVDLLGYSRGGLVLRSLANLLRHRPCPVAEVRRAVFVATPNAGTHLAEPENWNAFIDLYTNLAVAVFKLAGLLSQMRVTAAVLEESIKSLAGFIKQVPAQAIDSMYVPGLAAMRPNGAFLRALNAAPEAISGIERYAVTSNFVPCLLGGEHEPKEIPRRLVLMLIDAMVDRLIGADNDLVVNAASMGTLGQVGSDGWTDRLDYGDTSYVYHTTYFLRPEISSVLKAWLGDGGAVTFQAHTGGSRASGA